jgi:ABC-2 type transport system ATP-binding protein
MLSVRDLRKRYGDIVAVDGVTFDVDKGDILGFLGPNGAGKSTTMKIVTGFIPPTSGSAMVDGFDVARDSLEVRRRIGYLPENAPLYGEMRVEEYLRFRAKLKEIPRRLLSARVEEVMEKLLILDRRRQLISTLSKGYRQRVGIADAIVGDPQLLILDEPMIGLDPNQIREVRSLIKDLGERHTILLSTHILSDVEVVCDKVLIISAGKVRAQDTVTGLVHRFQAHAIRAAIHAPGVVPEDVGKALGEVAGVKKVDVRGRSRVAGEPEDVVQLRLAADGGARDDGALGRIRAICEAVGKRVFEKGWTVRDLSPEKTTLEDIFVKLTTGEDGDETEEPRAVAAAAAPSEPAAGSSEVKS